MIFNNAELLSYSHQSNFFGGDVIRYRTTKQVEVQGYLLNLTNSSGVSGVVSGVAALELSANDWDNYIINGTNFGSGKITNISFEDNNDVRLKKYTASLDIQETGSLLNLPTGNSYSGITYNNYKFVDSLTETLDLERNFDKDVYTHNINIDVSTSDVTNSINIAKQIARNLFESNNFNSYIGDYYGISGKKSIYQESYDKIKGSCSFNQTLELFANQSGNYSINKEYSYKREQNGVVTVSEKGDIKTAVEPFIDILTNAYQLESSNALTNCQAVFNAYKEGDTYALNTSEITKGTSLSRYEKMLSYEHVFSNDFSINSGYFWEYANDSSIDEKGTITTNEQGTIVGRGHRVDTKYANALAGWDIVDNNINTRTSNAYDRYRTFLTLPYSTYTILKKQESYLKHIGQITYNWDYSNDASLIVGDPYIVNSQLTVTEQDQIPLTNKFNIFNYGEIEQSTNNFIVSQKSVAIELRGKRNTPIDYYLTYAKSLILTGYKGDFLVDANYALAPFSNTFTLNASWGKVYGP